MPDVDMWESKVLELHSGELKMSLVCLSFVLKANFFYFA